VLAHLDARRRRLRSEAARLLGHEHFRDGQEEALLHALERDTLVVLPSGRGKSAIYQLAGELLDGQTVVVSPTIALQHDQVTGMRGSALLVNSTLARARRREALSAYRDGSVEFLFLAPEQLERADVAAALRSNPPSLLVVDEAHLVAEWGPEFRPHYLRIGAVAAELGAPRILALTATASPSTRREIIDLLRMRDAAVVVRGADRPNIWLGVRTFADARQQRRELLEAVSAEEGPGIVYVATRRLSVELAADLTELGTPALSYHGGLGGQARSSAHDAFMSGRRRVVVATSAFGMGVDKPDVRFVYHLGPSESVDAYFQEVGRAGRDGEPARALLYVRSQDFGLRRFFSAGKDPTEAEIAAVLAAVHRDPGRRRASLARATGWSRDRLLRVLNVLDSVGAVRLDLAGAVHPGEEARTPGELAEAAAVSLGQRRALEQSRVEMMRTYAETLGCRRRVILELLGEETIKPCGRCDTCERGTAQAADARPYGLGERVLHEEFGLGTVSHYEADMVVVLFEDLGYKTLSMPVVEERGLLQHAPRESA